MHLAQNRELSDAYLQGPGKPLVSLEDLAFDEVWCISLEVWTRGRQSKGSGGVGHS